MNRSTPGLHVHHHEQKPPEEHPRQHPRGGVRRDIHSHLLSSKCRLRPCRIGSSSTKPPETPEASAHPRGEILQARILEWVVMPSSGGSSRPRNRTRISCSSCVAGRFFIPRSYCVYCRPFQSLEEYALLCCDSEGERRYSILIWRWAL